MRPEQQDLANLSFEQLLQRLHGYVMSPQEKRAQQFSFAIGNVLCMRVYAEMSPAARDEAEWQMRIGLAKHLESLT